jgi:hypothetical protein
MHLPGNRSSRPSFHQQLHNQDMGHSHQDPYLGWDLKWTDGGTRGVASQQTFEHPENATIHVHVSKLNRTISELHHIL